jgi:tRNA nucleotidyltransferase/poly(A) polymerase
MRIKIVKMSEIIENITQKRKRIVKKVEVYSYNIEQPRKISITEPLITYISNLANYNDVQAYIVGGFVRDYFLKRERKDFDFTILGDPIDFARKVAAHFKSKAVVFERFRTAMVPVGGFNLEFVGTRKETYQPDSRNPVVTEGTLEDDLLRRDFTVNSLAASLNPNNFGEIIDLFSGFEDIQKRILKTPLDPAVTFSDDPLRMMRAARFASQLNFEIEPNCLQKMSEMSERIKIISQERITDEFIKILDSPQPSVGLSILFQTGLLKIIFPELHNLAGVDLVYEGDRTFAHKDVFRHSLKVLDNISNKTKNTWLRFAALVHDIAKPKTKKFIDGVGWSFHGHEDLGAKWMSKIFKRMKLPLENQEYVEKLIRLHQRPMVLVDDGISDSAVRRLAYQAGAALEDLFTLVRADITTKNPNLSEQYRNNYEIVFQKVIDVQEKDKLREFQSPVRGEEIMEICGIEPSKPVGIIKTKIEEAILDGLIPNDYLIAKQYFLDNKEKWMKEIMK